MSVVRRAVETAIIPTISDLWRDAGIQDLPAWGDKVQLLKTPFKHQIEDVNFLAANLPRAALWNEPGVGKTLSAQALNLWLVGLGNKVVIVMPPVLVEQFRAAFHANFAGLGYYVKIESFEGERAERDAKLCHWEQHGWPDVLVMSYKMFVGREKAPKRKDCKDTDADYQWLPGDKVTAKNFGWQVLLAKGYTSLTIDESTAIKSPSTAIYAAVKEFVQPDGESNGLILMSGTPIENTVEDAYGPICRGRPETGVNLTA